MNTFDQIEDNETISDGYDNIGDAFDAAVEEYQAAYDEQSKAGVCARVVIKIEQELVLTRSAFMATLELFNEGKRN